MKLKIKTLGGRAKSVALGAASISALILATGAPHKFW
jgi:hypothetical protein